MTALVVSLCVINVAAWTALFVKWRKLFSTDDVISKARSEMDSMIRDIDRAAMRDMSLVEDGEKRIRRLLDELDRRMALAQTETVKAASASALMDTVSSKGKPLQAARRAADSYKKNAARLSPGASRPLPGGDGVAEAGKKITRRRSLFDDASASVKTAAEVEAPPDGASHARIPVVEPPEVHISKTPVKAKKNFKDAVSELSELGLDVAEIAKRLSRSQVEVQTVLDLL